MQKTILSLIPTEEPMRARFEALAARFSHTVRFRTPDTVRAEDYADASVILGTPPLSALRGAEKLEYLHLSMAGSNAYVAPGVLPAGARLTNSTGAFGHAISEHMIGMLFELYKKLALYRDNQREGLWRDEGPVRSVEGASCLVVGLGDIGSAFARRAHALGVRVSGVRRTSLDRPPYIERMIPFERLGEEIGAFDIVALSLPETPDTVRLFDAAMLGRMKDGAVLLNVGRGSAVDSDALAAALLSGKLSGCGLDVTEPEPLPPEHPLWRIPSAVITPHVSGFFHLRETYENIVALAYENLEAYLTGAPLKNEVDFSTGYRKAKEGK